MNSLIVGIDIGGTNFRIGAVDKTGTVSRFRKIPVGELFHTNDPLRNLSDYLVDYCAGLSVDAISIGFPATLNRARCSVLQAPNLPFMEQLPVVDELKRILHIPVLIERDVTMALTYDCQKYGLEKRLMVCGFYFGTGIGNAIFLNGKPWLGKHGTAGELGHIPADGSGILCGCGNIGCIENLAGGKYLAELCQRIFSGTPIQQLFIKHGDAPELKQFIDRMAIAVATEVNILDPDEVLIGGGVPNMEGFPQEMLQDRIRQRTRKPYPADDLHIIFTEDEEKKGVVGAAWYAAQHEIGA